MKPCYNLLYLCMLFILSCSKDDSAPLAKSRMDLLTGGSSKVWRVQIEKINNTAYTIPDCDKDDRFIFSKNGNYTVAFGSVKCNNAQPDTATVGWKLINDEKSLVVMNPGDTEIVNIFYLSDTQLTLEYYKSDNNGNLVTLLDTYVPF